MVREVETQISALAAPAICMYASLMVAICISEDIMEHGENKRDVSSRSRSQGSFPSGMSGAKPPPLIAS
jgi:hypothetical protein